MGETIVTTQIDTSDPSGIAPLDSVGTIYEVGINGIGYMLMDLRESMPELRYRRGSTALDPQRFATSDTPFAESIERYVFSPFSDWTKGAGQVFADRPDSDPAAFYDSLGVDPFTTRGELTLLPDTQASGAAAAATSLIAISNSRLYLRKNGTTINWRTALDDAGTDVATFTDITDIASDGQYLYVADNGIISRAVAAPFSTWSHASVTAAKTVSWAGQRIAISEVASGSTPNQWDTLAEDGTRETAIPRLTLDAGWTIGKTVAGAGFLWFPAWTTTEAVIFRWQIGSDDAPVVAWEAPTGILLSNHSLFFYQDNLMIRGYHDVDGTTLVGYIYRSALDQTLSPVPSLVVTLEDTGVDHSQGGWGADRRYVFFGWDKMDGTNAGVGCIDLSTGGYAKWLVGQAAGPVRSIVQWKQRLHFSVDAHGADREIDDYVASGQVTTSVTDKNSTLSKMWDEVRLLCLPLLAGESITVEGSVDQFATWNSITDAMVSQLGGIGIDAEWAVKSQSAALRITINRGTVTTVTPTLKLAQLRLHPLGLADQIVVLPINCSDKISDLRKKPLPENAPGAGAARANYLEGLSQGRVKYQDVDWKYTQVANIWEVEDVTVERVGLRDRSTGKLVNHMVAIVTLRRLLR